MIKAEDERAEFIYSFLSKGVVYGDYYSASRPVKYDFRVDNIL
ncbi:MAG: hypothetical protein OQK82_05845 [Candidatus Pacearchaeota archaeon]|nr:hypothetical protein [Candidatus Pacearchaeota archaeon]